MYAKQNLQSLQRAEIETNTTNKGKEHSLKTIDLLRKPI